jgi:serine/threonine protein kinase
VPSSRLLVPERIGPYAVKAPLGIGGMATVYRAARPGENQIEVAVKLVHAHLRSQPEMAIELLEEAKLTAKVRHPNVVSVLDLGEDASGIFLVLDYVEGASLADLCALASRTKKPVPPAVGVMVLCDALEGLHAAHELKDAEGRLVGLVHRDFTPQNILVGLDGIGRLSDFGIAKAQIRAQTTKDGFVKGKAAYMAPEQIRGKDVDRRCDVWAAGAVAWEVIAGHRLYAVDDINALFRIVTEDPPALSGGSSEVQAVISRALCRSLDGRYGTAEELRRELLRAWTVGAALPGREEIAREVKRAMEARPAIDFVLDGRTVPLRRSADPPTLPPSAQTLEQRRPRRRWMPWIALGAAAGVGAAIAMAWPRRPPPAPPLPDPTPPPAAAVPLEPVPSPPANAKMKPVKSARTHPKPPATLPGPRPLAGNPYEQDR